MEFGFALALNKIKGKLQIYVVGEFKNKSPWFFNPSINRVDSIEEILEKI